MGGLIMQWLYAVYKKALSLLAFDVCECLVFTYFVHVCTYRFNCVRYQTYMGCQPTMCHMHICGTGAALLYIQLVPWRYTQTTFRTGVWSALRDQHYNWFREQVENCYI